MKPIGLRYKAVAGACSALLFIGAGLGLWGCSRDDGSGADSGGSVTVKGSDTMVYLVSAWAEDFMSADEQAEVSVTGGGSGTGIAALLNGTTDICAASRQIKEKELKLAEQKGIKPIETAVARDGIAVIVNPDNPVTELALSQLKGIFTGTSRRWSDFAGPDEEIEILSRESSSGTYVFFQEAVLDKQDYCPQAKLMPATSAIIQSVSNDKWAIGYVGLGYAEAAGDKVKVVAVKSDADSSAVMPSEATVRSGDYLMARPLFFYTNGQPRNAVAAFMSFCLSDKGQEIVKNNGYVPVR